MLSFYYNILISEDAQSIAEYALILALMVLACVVGFTALGPAIKDRVTTFSNEAYN